jgi:hypothetical protein
MNNELLKLLNLSQKNNDRLVIYNPENPDKSWVAVSLQDYQKLVNEDKIVDKAEKKEQLTGSESSDKIESIEESDKELRKEGEEVENSGSDDISDEQLNSISGNREVYSDPSIPTSVKDVLENKRDKWQIPRQVKDSATEVIE